MRLIFALPHLLDVQVVTPVAAFGGVSFSLSRKNYSKRVQHDLKINSELSPLQVLSPARFLAANIEFQ